MAGPLGGRPLEQPQQQLLLAAPPDHGRDRSPGRPGRSGSTSSSRQTFCGSAAPLTVSGPAGSAFTASATSRYVSSPIRISPAPAAPRTAWPG